ncbi:MAG TPA: DUF2141 domain-containing protein [Flavobacteriia bacterium]|nr:DUF2141 domain-containing protein [Flavobacteriia bacterium]
MIKKIILLTIVTLLMSFNYQEKKKTYSLKITVNNLRNSKGIVQVALYTKEGSIPDEKYEKYYAKAVAKIVHNSAIFTFKDLPEGKYAVNILHDENENGKIDKKFIMPKEGIGFSNYKSIGFSNRPKFSKASFQLNADTEKNIKIIYL